MKKFILIFFLLFFLTGCDVEYNIELKDDVIYETIDIKGMASTKQQAEAIKEESLYVTTDQDRQYEKEIVATSNGYINRYKTNYFYKNMNKSFVANSCYDMIDVHEGDNRYYFITSDKVECSMYKYEYVNNITISFKTNHKVINHNADYVKDGVYYWKVNLDENQIKPLTMVVDKNTTDLSQKKSYNFDFVFTLLITVGTILGVGIIFIIYIYVKNKKNNKL